MVDKLGMGAPGNEKCIPKQSRAQTLCEAKEFTSVVLRKT